MKAGSYIWHAKRIDLPNAEIEEFETPKKIILRNNYFTCQPALSGGYLTILQFGEMVSSTWICKANAMAFSGRFKEGDLLWVDGNEPKIADSYVNSANARIVKVNAVDKVITIIAEQNQIEQ
jgi:hypothetical protein